MERRYPILSHEFIQCHGASGHTAITWHPGPQGTRGWAEGWVRVEVCPSGPDLGQRVTAPCAAMLGGDGKPSLLFPPISSHSGQRQPAGTPRAVFGKGRKPLGAFAVSRIGVFLDHTSKYGRLFVFNSLTH